MKISVITVVRNAQAIIEKYNHLGFILVSEPDDGLYDAMNKGVSLASGDVIGMLNADDVYQDDSVLQQIANAHQELSVWFVF